MKTTTLARNGVSSEMVDLISRLVDLIPWPSRRCAMGDVTLLLLDGTHRVAEVITVRGRNGPRGQQQRHGCSDSHGVLLLAKEHILRDARPAVELRLIGVANERRPLARLAP